MLSNTIYSNFISKTIYGKYKKNITLIVKRMRLYLIVNKNNFKTLSYI